MKYKKSHLFFGAFGDISKSIRKVHPKIKLHPGEFSTLSLIHGCICVEDNSEGDVGVTISELCEKSGSSKPAISKMITSLEDKQYVERSISHEDRRVVFVKITEEGRALLEESFSIMFHITEETLDSMGEEKSQLLMELLKEFNVELMKNIEKGI